MELPDVGLRPLSIEFTMLPMLEKRGVAFSQDVVVSLWDVALDSKADVSVINNVTEIAPMDTECELTLLAGDMLEGTSTATIDISK